MYVTCQNSPRLAYIFVSSLAIQQRSCTNDVLGPCKPLAGDGSSQSELDWLSSSAAYRSQTNRYVDHMVMNFIAMPLDTDFTSAICGAKLLTTNSESSVVHTGT